MTGADIEAMTRPSKRTVPWARGSGGLRNGYKLTPLHAQSVKSWMRPNSTTSTKLAALLKELATAKFNEKR